MAEAGLLFAVSLTGGIKLFKDVNILLGSSESARERSIGLYKSDQSVSQTSVKYPYYTVKM